MAVKAVADLDDPDVQAYLARLAKVLGYSEDHTR